MPLAREADVEEGINPALHPGEGQENRTIEVTHQPIALSDTPAGRCMAHVLNILCINAKRSSVRPQTPPGRQHPEDNSSERSWRREWVLHDVARSHVSCLRA